MVHAFHRYGVHTTTGMRAYLGKVDAAAPGLASSKTTDVVSSIKHIELIDDATKESRIYDLNGRYLSTNREVLGQGVYVIGGQKVQVR